MKNSYVDSIYYLCFVVTDKNYSVTDKMAGPQPKAHVAFAEDSCSVGSEHPQDGS